MNPNRPLQTFSWKNRLLSAALVVAASILAAAPAAAGLPKTSAIEPPPAVLQAESQRIAVMARVRPAVVAIFAGGGQGGGSGALISADGYALTNFHVAQPCGNAMKCGLADGRVYDAVLVGLDPTGDVALIQLLGRDDFPHVELGDSDSLGAGDWVFAMGNPFPAGLRLSTDRHLRHRLRDPSLPAAGRHVAGVRRLHSDRRLDQPGQFGRAAVRHGRPAGWRQRPLLLPEARTGQRRRRLRRFGQPDQELSGLPAERADRRPRQPRRPRGQRRGRPRCRRRRPRTIRRLSPRAARGRRSDRVRRPSHHHAQRLQERAGHIPQGVARADEFPPRGEAIRRERAAGRGPSGRGAFGEDFRPSADAAHAHPQAQRGSRKKGGGNGRPAPFKLPIPQIPLPDDFWKLFQPPDNSLPEIVRKRFEQKRGYANYYFNKLNQNRVFRAWAAKTDFAGLDGPWTIAGLANGGRKFAFELSDAGAAMQLPGGEVKWESGPTLASSLLPAGSGGLLPALYLWRRLALLGPERFGLVECLGLAPLPGRQSLVDVLTASHKGVESWFYFDPAGGQLLAMEMYPSENADPCEVYFSDYREMDGRLLPGRMEVRISDERFGVFAIEHFAFAKGGKK